MLEFSRKSLPIRPFHPKCLQSHSVRVQSRAKSNHFQSLTASNFEALWPTDLKFSAFKDLNFFSIVLKVQEAGSILRVGFALSKWPHFHRVYLVTVCKRSSIAVYISSQKPFWLSLSIFRKANLFWTLEFEAFSNFFYYIIRKAKKMDLIWSQKQLWSTYPGL